MINEELVTVRRLRQVSPATLRVVRAVMSDSLAAVDGYGLAETCRMEKARICRVLCRLTPDGRSVALAVLWQHGEGCGNRVPERLPEV